MQTIKAGARGTDVLAAQNILNIGGFKTAADGIFGINTERQVEAFQKSRSLPVDGIIGDKTWTALELMTPNSGGTVKDAGKFIEGVDTSHWEEGFDFVKGVKDGIIYMMTKASESLSPDSTYVKLVTEAKEAGIKYTGLYHFFHCSVDVKDQVLEYLKQYNAIKTEFPPILDFESGSIDNKTYSQAKELALQWLLQAEATTGRIPLLYIGMDTLKETDIADDARFDKYALWIARYSVTEPPFNWTFWQNTDKGEQNADTDRFHGDEADLRKYLGMAAV